jgi:hypothetical protein
MSKKYVYVTGGKGGIGKSTMALAIVDYLAETGPVLLIDADPINADSAAAYKHGKQSNVRSIRQSLRSEDSSGQVDASGLTATLNLLEDDPANSFVVDAPAGETTLLVEAGAIITSACKAVGAKSIFVWLVDSQDKTPVNALASSWPSIKDADKIIIVKNYKTGDNFTFFDNANSIKEIIGAANVQVIGLAKIASRLVEHFRIERMTWLEVATKTPVGNRMEGDRIRKQMHANLKEAGL